MELNQTSVKQKLSKITETKRSLTCAYYYHITFVARLSSHKAFIDRRLGWGGAVVRALPSHQCGPESYPDMDAICGLSLLLVLSLAMRGFFPGTSVFPSPQKPTFPNYNSTRNQVYEEPLCGCATFKSLLISLFIEIPECGIHQGRQQLYNCFGTQHTSSHHTKAEVNNCFTIHKKYFLTDIPPRRLSSKLWPISRSSFLFFLPNTT